MSEKIMSRSRNQIASAYAPESFFTFEGGLGACIARAIPTREEPLGDTSVNQLYERVEEVARSWYDQASSCRDTQPEKFPVLPVQCIDKAFLNGDRTGYESLSTSKMVLMQPSKMGYVPAPLTFVCETCKLVRTYGTMAKLESDLPILSNPDRCPHPKGNRGKACDWRQLDVLFVHWSGRWERAMPHQYHWDNRKKEVVLKYEECSCGCKDFLLEKSKSGAIGDWFFRCASCNKPVSDKWLQNDFNTLEMLGERLTSPEIYTHARMEVTPYRASSVYSVASDQFIDFKDNSNKYLNLLLPSNLNPLLNFIGKQYGFASEMPGTATLKSQAIAGGADKEWAEYESTENTKKALEAIATAIPPESRLHIMNSVHEHERAKQRILNDLISRKIIQPVCDLPSSLKERVTDRSKLFATRYDPFRLAAEHAALKEAKLEPGLIIGGKRAFVSFRELDEDLSPEDATQKATLQDETRSLLDLMGVDTMGLIREFDLCKFSFGYSRMSSTPVIEGKRGQNMPVRLNLFPGMQYDGKWKHPIYVVTQANEAIYVKLKPEIFFEWLLSLDCPDMFELDAGMSVGAGLLESAYPMNRYLDKLPKSNKPSVYLYAYHLLHTFSHLLMKQISEYSGLDLGSLGEYLFPADLAFVVYRNGTTMDLGNLSAMWRNSNVSLLRAMLRPKACQCGSGSLCSHRGGACPDCLMIPETACIASNKLLSRSVLRSIGGKPSFDTREDFTVTGYLSVAGKANS